ncbi:MAG: ribosomal protein S18-alanine N-acetyltransferase [Verrucomicrobia bacterium]|nr:ribosomal protein S18-alanine N-acetyltransferase [Leptolyngbya sp. ES-bin-22]
MEEPEDRGQETEEGRGKQEAGSRKQEEGAGETGERENPDSPVTTQNSKLSSAAARSATPNSKLLTPLLGLGCYWAILEEAHITMLAIDPAYQHQGLGQALLHALMSSAHQRGLERATLEVRLSNQAALALYQKFDFREAGRRRRYYPDNGEDALVLWRGGLQAPEFSDHVAVWQRQVDHRLHETGWQLTDGRSSSV